MDLEQDLAYLPLLVTELRKTVNETDSSLEVCVHCLRLHSTGGAHYKIAVLEDDWEVVKHLVTERIVVAQKADDLWEATRALCEFHSTLLIVVSEIGDMIAGRIEPDRLTLRRR